MVLSIPLSTANCLAWRLLEASSVIHKEPLVNFTFFHLYHICRYGSFCCFSRPCPEYHYTLYPELCKGHAQWSLFYNLQAMAAKYWSHSLWSDCVFSTSSTCDLHKGQTLMTFLARICSSLEYCLHSPLGMILAIKIGEEGHTCQCPSASY